jgi:hypothetical protein
VGQEKGSEFMDWLYVDQERGVSSWTGCIWLRRGV